MKSTQKAFTLVELIVVITILAILGTIAFISLGSYTGDARNAKRTDAIGKIATSMENAITNGTSILSFAANANSALTTPSIAGANQTTTTYNAGDANYSALGVKASDFQDPNDGTAYKVGVTTKLGGKYEVAASLESGAERRAQVIGVWSPRESTSVATVAVTGQSDKLKLSNVTDINTLRSGDTVTDSASTTAVVNSVSNDGLVLTFSADLVAGAITMVDETAGLIAWVDATGTLTPTIAVEDDALVLPY